MPCFKAKITSLAIAPMLLLFRFIVLFFRGMEKKMGSKRINAPQLETYEFAGGTDGKKAVATRNRRSDKNSKLKKA